MSFGGKFAALKHTGEWGWLAIWGLGEPPDAAAEVSAAGFWSVIAGNSIALDLEDAPQGLRPVLQEQRQYVVTVHSSGVVRVTWGWDGAPLRTISLGDEAVFQLETGNSVGQSQFVVELADAAPVTVPFRIANRKLGADRDFEWLVDELARAVRALALTMTGPTRLPTSKTSSNRSLGYEDLIFLSSVVRDVERAVDSISTRPHHKLVYESEWRDIGSVAELEPRDLERLVGAGHSLTRADEDAHRRVLPSAARMLLRTVAGLPVLPARLPVRGRYISYDTFENRFVRHALQRFGGRARAIAQDLALSPRAAAEAKSIDARCRAMLRHPFLSEVGVLTSMQATSQVLLRDDSYHRILRTYQEFLLSSDVDWEGLRQAQENRDVAELYEMWVYMEVVRALQSALGGSVSAPDDEQPVVMAIDERLVVSLRRDKTSGLRIRAANGTVATAYYNRSFAARRGEARPDAQSYSLPLRPDVVIEVWRDGTRRFVVLDAKYRVERIGDAFSQETEDEDSSAGPATTFKASDVHKMHAYRDAIDDVAAAVAVYPGSELSENLYPRVGFRQTGGVGAVPLRPGGGVHRLPLQRTVHAALAAAGASTSVTRPQT